MQTSVRYNYEHLDVHHLLPQQAYSRGELAGKDKDAGCRQAKIDEEFLKMVKNCL
jgi:hypothetical protein